MVVGSQPMAYPFAVHPPFHPNLTLTRFPVPAEGLSPANAPRLATLVPSFPIPFSSIRFGCRLNCNLFVPLFLPDPLAGLDLRNWCLSGTCPQPCPLHSAQPAVKPGFRNRSPNIQSKDTKDEPPPRLPLLMATDHSLE
jgi:hypothetical protein